MKSNKASNVESWGGVAILNRVGREFPGGLVVRIPGFHCRGPGSVPGQGTESPASSVAKK